MDGAHGSPDPCNGVSGLRKPVFRRRSTGITSSTTSLVADTSPTPCATPMNTDFGESAGTPKRAGHIRVAVRVRPLPHGEQGIIDVAGEGVIAIRKEAATGGNQFLATQQGRIEGRQFDRVFGPNARQEEVYAWTCEPLVQEAVAEGRNATVFVYGATGAGKTHTMFGAEEEGEHGIIFRTIHEVFDSITDRECEGLGDEYHENGDADEPSSWLEVKISFLELYNEVVRDLLQDGSGQAACRVLEDERRGVVQISNLVEIPVRNAEEALYLLRAGMQARTVEATAANSQSSRAHAVFSLSVDRVSNRPQGRSLFKNHNGQARSLHSKINLIDLAGSERAKDTHNSGSALKDGARINQSLLALANCIDALTAQGSRSNSAKSASQRKKPPYRDSKLTLMLKGSLTGEGLVAMVANVHPGRSHFEDSNNTLEYAMRASTVKPRDQQRCRASLAGMQPPAMFSAPSNTRRRLSDPGPPPSARGRRGVQATHEEEATCTASSSTLPAPKRTAVERAAVRNGKKVATAGQANTRPNGLDAKRTAFAWENVAEVEVAVADDDSESIASSLGSVSPLRPEELHADDAVPFTPAFSKASSLGVATPPCDKDDAMPIGALSPAECLSGLSLASDDEVPNTECAETFSSPAKGSLVTPTLAARIIETLQAEKVEMDARLHSIQLERDSLLQDRAVLEEANARLRAASLEKDQQLAELLFAATLPGVSIFTKP